MAETRRQLALSSQNGNDGSIDTAEYQRQLALAGTVDRSHHLAEYQRQLALATPATSDTSFQTAETNRMLALQR